METNKPTRDIVMRRFQPELIGFAPLYNERKYIEGWWKNITTFCSTVWAIYDPRSNDGTNEWLLQKAEETKNEEIKLHLYAQDITLGDSTKYIKGTQKVLTFICNVNEWMHRYVPEGKWMMWLPADERFDPRDREMIWSALAIGDNEGADCMRHEFVDAVIDDQHRFAYERIPHFRLNQKRIYRRTRESHFNEGAHANERGWNFMMETAFILYHFGFLKNKDTPWWHENEPGCSTEVVSWLPEEKRYIEFENPFKDWVSGELKDDL